MPVRIIEQAPTIRCYKCGSIQAEAVCYRCGLAMCSSHILRSTDVAGKPLSAEFTGLGLKDTACGESPIHCENCKYSIKAPSMDIILIGVLIAVFALVIPLDWGVKLLGVLIGGSVASYGFHRNRQRAERLIQLMPPLPLLPRFNMLQLRETIRGKVILDSEGIYRVSIISSDGALTVGSSFGKPERDYLKQYREKYRLTDDEDVRFNAGFAVPRGPIGIKFNDRSGINKNLITVLTDKISAHPYLHTADSRGTGEWSGTRKYNLLTTLDSQSLPIRLVPSLIQKYAQRALDLEIQWLEPEPPESRLTIHRIGLLELHVPVACGQIEEATGNATIGQAIDSVNNDAVRIISWRGLPITDEERKERRRTFFVRFEEAIDLRSTIRGRIDVTFKGTVSRIEGVDIYYPLGGKRDAETFDVATQILLEFELSLAGLRYQDICIVPGPNKDRDKEETMTFDGVIPDHNTVIALTSAMSDEFYVKRVIENPPRTGEQANVVNRYWDIAGRQYFGVYPIDYHLILAGETIYGGTFQPRHATTKATLTVQGVYANPEMEAQIGNVWIRLNHLIRTTLEQLPRVTSFTSQKEEGIGASPSKGHNETAKSDSQSQRIADLRKRLDQLLDLFIEGRLSEELFVKLKADIDQEMRTL